MANLIKRCNDFGAGGVSVAIGELADGLDINLDLVPKKYEGPVSYTHLDVYKRQVNMRPHPMSSRDVSVSFRNRHPKMTANSASVLSIIEATVGLRPFCP